MTTDVNAKIEELEKEEKGLKLEIEQVKAALGGRVDDAGDYAGYARLPFEERKPFLEKRLSELTAYLMNLREEKKTYVERLSQLPQQLPAQQAQPPQQEYLVPCQRTKAHRRQYQRRRRPLSSTQPTEISREASRLSPITEEP
mmetsp:Transcript_19344/g.62152  ORF Transcript_19344/g.62152 Transcript_19344/m.62152 type:complete len:143 (-) Transcript_19344:45-473(-)